MRGGSCGVDEGKILQCLNLLMTSPVNRDCRHPSPARLKGLAPTRQQCETFVLIPPLLISFLSPGVVPLALLVFAETSLAFPVAPSLFESLRITSNLTSAYNGGTPFSFNRRHHAQDRSRPPLGWHRCLLPYGKAIPSE